MQNNGALYYHGGPRGRQRGAMLLPPTLTGVESCSEYGSAHVHRRDRVYVTTSYNAATLFAAAHKRPVIYLCCPIGELEPDPDCSAPGLSWQCEKARVVRVINLSAREIRVARSALLEVGTK